MIIFMATLLFHLPTPEAKSRGKSEKGNRKPFVSMNMPAIEYTCLRRSKCQAKQSELLGEYCFGAMCRFNASGHSTRWKRKIEVRVTGNSDSTTPAATGESNASATKTTAPGANDDSVWFGDKIPDATGVGENGGVSTSQRDGLGGGDEKQDTGDIWGLGEEKAVARDEESGWGTGTGEDVPEVIVEPGDVLTAKDALLQVWKGLLAGSFLHLKDACGDRRVVLFM